MADIGRTGSGCARSREAVLLPRLSASPPPKPPISFIPFIRGLPGQPPGSTSRPRNFPSTGGNVKRTLLALAGAASLAAAFALPSASRALAASSPEYGHPLCEQNAATCTELNQPVANYTGHDEPSALFYSNTPGLRQLNIVPLTWLPTDPKDQPTQDGTGGTFNFQLHPAFWFGMAMCDDQSAPNPGGSSRAGRPCRARPTATPTSTTAPTPRRRDYIGQHPGTAFMEMQFYPPGWARLAGRRTAATPPSGAPRSTSTACRKTPIDRHPANNDRPARRSTGLEYVNFAFITKNGVSQAPANPVTDPIATRSTFTPDPAKDLFMNSGDHLTVDMHDTAAGFQVVIHDLTHRPDRLDDGQRGERVWPGQVRARTRHRLHQTSRPAFHPMYAHLEREHPRAVGGALLQRRVLRRDRALRVLQRRR